MSSDEKNIYRARFDAGDVEKQPRPLEGTLAEVARVTQQEWTTAASMHRTTRTVTARFGIGQDTVARSGGITT